MSVTTQDNGQAVPCQPLTSKTVYHIWKQEINFLLKNSIGNNLLDIPKGVNSYKAVLWKLSMQRKSIFNYTLL